MDKTVTYRFFEVHKHRPQGMSFADAIREIGNIPAVSDRESQIATNFDVRLERLEPEPGGILSGEITRIQRTNLPSEVEGDRCIPLSTENPLGHGIVFRYVPRRSTLGIQFDVRVAGPSRLTEYVSQMLEDAVFELRPIVRDDMWDRFNSGPTRKVTIGIARPANLQRLQRGAAAALATSIGNMADAYEAPNIKIEMSMGSQSGSLSDAVKGMAKWFFDKHARGDLVLNSLKAVAEVGDGPNDDIDLLSDLLSVKVELPLHDRDPDVNYHIRRDELRTQMNAWIR